MTPSTKAESLHYWGAIQATHACIGALVATLATDAIGGWLSLVLCGLFGLWYVAVKEGGDVRSGGSPRDSAADTFFVWLGLVTAYTGNFFYMLTFCLLAGVLVKAYLMSKER